MPIPPPLTPPSVPTAYVAGTQVGTSLAQMQRHLREALPEKAASSPLAAALSSAGEQAALFTAAQDIPNLNRVLRRSIDGQPVIPPGMTPKQASMYVSHDWMQQHINHAKTLVFVSMSMPKDTLRAIFSDIWDHPSLRTEAVVIVRGWPAQPLGLPKMVQQIAALQPAANKQVNVAVDPILFESYNISRVPAVARRQNSGKWVMLFGDKDLPSLAVARLDAGKDVGATLGQTWAIAEPDLIQVLKERMKTYDWARHAQQANAHFFAMLPAYAPALPESRRALTFFHSPAIVVTHDIRLPDGRLVAKAGQVINPLENTAMPWSTWRAIVFNAQVPWEVQQAKSWAAQYPTARLMMTNPPDTQAGYTKLQFFFGRPVFIASPLVTNRLGVTYSPALVWPDGPQLQIRVAPIPDDPAYGNAKHAQ